MITLFTFICKKQKKKILSPVATLVMPMYTRYPENMPWLETFHCLNFGCNIKVLLAKSISLST